jgi:hypothetical protein
MPKRAAPVTSLAICSMRGEGDWDGGGMERASHEFDINKFL